MPITNKPAATTFQVGATVYVPYVPNDATPKAVVIESTESIVTDVDENGVAEQVDYYYFVGYPGFKLPVSKVFTDKTALEAYTDALIDSV